ncbi:20233_t:CDS:2, partial [Gigaspora rosea]
TVNIRNFTFFDIKERNPGFSRSIVTRKNGYRISSLNESGSHSSSELIVCKLVLNE